ncbi:MAG TPA: hypothetical protein DDW20_01360 [Firmicutes bacterium]|nr:hypothetical protein [Bacillota bacterium]
MLKKLSQTFYIISIVLSAVGIATYLTCGIIFSTVIPLLYQAGEITGIVLPPEYSGIITVDEYVSLLAISMGIAFFELTVMSMLSLIFSVKARKDQTKNMYIISIVFGALSSTYFGIAAGILGLISESKKEE